LIADYAVLARLDLELHCSQMLDYDFHGPLPGTVGSILPAST
jgi:hypothetical protein